MRSIKNHKLLTLTLFFLIYTTILVSIPCIDGSTEKYQPDGTVFIAKVSGDEFSWRYYDENNYTMIQDPQTNIWCWAVENEKGGLNSSKYPVHLHDPQSLGLKPGAYNSPKRSGIIYQYENSRCGSTRIQFVQSDGTMIKVTKYINLFFDSFGCEYDIDGGKNTGSAIIDEVTGDMCWAVIGDTGWSDLHKQQLVNIEKRKK
ncbi:MAG: hypothetical protein FWG20_03690 [Candidatus Cloacimonetes bacterium]|nr:hypothetical protein [Candidatus Cloacimonadota bacterium]